MKHGEHAEFHEGLHGRNAAIAEQLSDDAVFRFSVRRHAVSSRSSQTLRLESIVTHVATDAPEAFRPGGMKKRKDAPSGVSGRGVLHVFGSCPLRCSSP
ncbi:single-stranded DNA exonuclease RecJ [Bifidobacterium adolescentis]|nr:single-stranded DNA exonuclease RecJ [Bifidobacterium adolescentis]